MRIGLKPCAPPPWSGRSRAATKSRSRFPASSSWPTPWAPDGTTAVWPRWCSACTAACSATPAPRIGQGRRWSCCAARYPTPPRPPGAGRSWIAPGPAPPTGARRWIAVWAICGKTRPFSRPTAGALPRPLTRCGSWIAAWSWAGIGPGIASRSPSPICACCASRPIRHSRSESRPAARPAKRLSPSWRPCWTATPNGSCAIWL